MTSFAPGTEVTFRPKNGDGTSGNMTGTVHHVVAGDGRRIGGVWLTDHSFVPANRLLRSVPIGDVKGGDTVADGREVFDVRPTWGASVKVLFCDGTHVLASTTDSLLIRN